jgi:predicted phage terminase large subunit-like protein
MFARRRGYQWIRSNHHKIICDALMRVFNGECKRLIINVPPRYSKTELAVVNFVAWAMGKVPDSEFIHASYSAQLAANNSAQIRSMVQHEDYQRIFPDCALDSDARSHWTTTKGGVMYAAGAGGTITGFGAGKHRDGFGGCILIDDPHKADEARSDVIRENVIDWFQNTLESRRNSPDTPIVLIMQRLHERDLAGWLLNGGNGEEWDHVCLPAIQDDGSALWEDKHKIEDLRRMEQAAPYVFAGQYMQSPAPAEGGLFKPDQLQVIDALPAQQITWVRGWDLASTTTGDYTAGVKLGKLPDGRFIIANVVRIRVGPDERDAAITNTAAVDGFNVKISIPQDPGQAGKTQVLYLTRALSGYRVTSSPESGDKVTRAEPVAAQVNIGNVMMLRGEWNEQLKDEMRMFPNGANDDQVDGLSRAFGELIGNQAMQRMQIVGI